MELIAAGFIALFGLMILAMSLYGLARPRAMLERIATVIDSGRGWGLAVGIRIVFGAALILSAPVSIWPALFKAVGYIAVVAAVIILLIGPRSFMSLFRWIERRSDIALRVWLLLAAGFSSLLIYCVYQALL